MDNNEWRPENEVNEDQKKEAKQLMRRDETMTILMSIVEAQIGQKIGVEAAVNDAIKQAPKILKFLDDTAPF